MSKAHPLSVQKRAGMGLIEVMVSLVIGLMVMGSLSYLLIGGKRINKTQDDLSLMQENARFALSLIGKAIRQSGYRLDVSQPLAAPAIEGSDGRGSGASARPDVITLRSDPVWVADKANPLQGEQANCVGAVITSNNQPDPKSGIHPVNSKLIVSGFEIDKSELRCRTSRQNGSKTSAILVSNIENMQFLYGIASDNGEIIRYETADKVQDFSRVASVRVELLMIGNHRNAGSGKAQQLVFNGATLTSSDGYLRRVYSATFAIRNRSE